MINLLPRDLARQLAFAKANARLLSYVHLVTFVILILAGIFAGSIFFLQRQQESLAASLEQSKRDIAEYRAFEAEAKDAAARLAAIKQLEGEQTRFTTLLADLAAALPRSVALQGISLTGDHTKPVRIVMTASTYESGVAARNAIAASPRIAAADLESVGRAQADGPFEVIVTLAFKPGQAR